MTDIQAAASEVLQPFPLNIDLKQSAIARVVLLVEDQARVREATAAVLENNGYRVLKARNALEAEAQFHSEKLIQLLIADVVLPGQNGLDLARELRSRLPELHVIFISGYPENAWTQLGQSEMEALYLPKPFSGESLMNAVEKVLRSTRKIAV
jgi:two-component system, cell cycle sensor histidine kinase and response regulator CckA